jgi:tRNA threonylcarbamoyl adenosine modification protein YeaZ
MNKNKKSEPIIIAVETSGRYGSAALAQGSQFLKEVRFSSAMKHSAELLAVIEKMLNDFGKKPEQIEQVYISIGPGSFTGLRIAVAFAKAMFIANQSKIIAVNTLDVIAANIEELGKHKKIGTILDAKRGQFFAAAYELEGTNKYKKTLNDCLITADEFIKKCADSQNPMWLLGEGLVYYRDNFKTDGINFLDEQYWWPKASKVHQLGCEKAQDNLFEDAYSLQPFYLRQPQLGKSPLQQE